MRSCLIAVALALTSCGAAPTPPITPASSTVAAEAVEPPFVEAMAALLAAPYCGEDACVDPFPVAGIRGVDAHARTLAFAGPGAVVGIFVDGAWEFTALPDDVAALGVTFAPDGTLFAVSDHALLRRDGDRWTEVVSAEDELWSAALARSRDEVWITRAEGVVVRVVGGHIEDFGPEPRAGGLDRIWESEGVIAVAGPYGGAVWNGSDWLSSATYEELERYGEQSGCGALSQLINLFPDVEEEIEDYASFDVERALRARSAERPPERSRIGDWLAELPRDAREIVRPWVERAPSSLVELAREGDDWAAISDDGHARAWARIGGDLRTWDLGFHPRAVALCGGVPIVAGDASIVRLDDAGRTIALPARAPIADLSCGSERTIALTSDGDVLAIDASGAVSLVHRIDRPMRAIAGDARGFVVVGPAGAIARSSDDSWSPVSVASTVDLMAVVSDGDRAWAAGAAGTLVRIEGTTATVLPRVTYEPLVDLREEDGVVIALGRHGSVLRTDGSAWSHRADAVQLPGFARWMPRMDGEWRPLARGRLDVALDEPDAVLPYRWAADWLDHATDTEGLELAALWAETEVDYVVETTTDGCCEGTAYDPAVIADASSCAEDPTFNPCMLEADPAFGVDAGAQRVLQVVEVGARDRDDCAPLRVDIVRVQDGGVERASPVLTCEAGRTARDAAAWSFLALPEQQAFATWREDTTAVFGSHRYAPLFVHRTPTADALLFVDRDNRTTWPVMTHRRSRGASAVDAWAMITRVRSSPDGATVLVGAQLEGPSGPEPFVWIGPPPARAEEPQPPSHGDVATCPSLLIEDPDGRTNVRAQPSSRAALVGALDNGTAFRARARKGRWIRLVTPLDGWVYRDNVRCAP